MTSNEAISAAAGVLGTAIVMSLYVYFTDTVDAGLEAADRELILKVLAEQELKSADGRPLTIAVNDNTKQLIKLNAQLPFIIQGIKDLNE